MDELFCFSQLPCSCTAKIWDWRVHIFENTAGTWGYISFLNAKEVIATQLWSQEDTYTSSRTFSWPVKASLDGLTAWTLRKLTAICSLFFMWSYCLLLYSELQITHLLYVIWQYQIWFVYCYLFLLAVIIISLLLSFGLVWLGFFLLLLLFFLKYLLLSGKAVGQINSLPPMFKCYCLKSHTDPG